MDWNNDGRHDLLIGDAEGKVQIYLNTNNNYYPILFSGNYIQSGGADIDVGERAAPVADDWNGDKKKDLLVGNMDGTINIFINTGNDSEPVFDSHYLLQVDGKDFDLGSRSAPRVYDWNGDGLKDILIGEMEGYIYFLKNVGSNNTPVFNRAEKLFLGNGDIIRYPDESKSARSRLFITDWNNDGHNDILMGGRDGKVILHQAASKPSSSIMVFAIKIWNQLKESSLKLIKYLGKLKRSFIN